MKPADVVRLVLLIIVVIALFVGGVLVKRHFNEFNDLKDFKASAKPDIEATQAIVPSLEVQQAAGTAQETSVGARRARLDRSFQEIQREDQTVAAWAATPIPQRLRDADAEAVDSAPGNGDGRQSVGDAEDGAGPNPTPR